MRPYLLRALLTLVVLTASAPFVTAQVGRVSGVVKDDSGQPIKGAMVIADNPGIGPATFTATTDDKGRFNIIGLRAGEWRFVAQAPGHSAAAGKLPVRFGTPNPPLNFTLRRNGPGPEAPLGNTSGRDLQEALAGADGLFNAGKWDEAIAAYRAILSRTPALSSIQLQIAAAHRAKRDYDGALAAYDALLSGAPENQKAKVGIAATHRERGDGEAAHAVLLEAASEPGAGSQVFFDLAESSLARGDVDAAEQWYGKAAEGDPSWGLPLYRLGTIATQKGDTGTASAMMRRVVTVDPISPEAALAQAALNELNR